MMRRRGRCRARSGFFLPVRVLSRVYRSSSSRAFRVGRAGFVLVWPLAQGKIGRRAGCGPWLSSLYAKDWVVYAKPPFGGPEQVLKYLARYTHRVAISNHRLLKLEAGRVSFRYRDYADSRKEKLLTLPAEEFLPRALRITQHAIAREGS